MKILAVGWNYRLHNAEMGREESPAAPTVFMKPETALLKDGKPFFLPHFSERIEHETEADLVCRLLLEKKNTMKNLASCSV